MFQCICYIFQIISNKYKAVQLNGDEFEQTPGDSEGQGSLECCSYKGLQRVGYELVTEQQQRDVIWP